MCPPFCIEKKGYGANRTLLWLPRVTSSVKVFFQMWLCQPKNTCTSVKDHLGEMDQIPSSIYIIHDSAEKSITIIFLFFHIFALKINNPSRLLVSPSFCDFGSCKKLIPFVGSYRV